MILRLIVNIDFRLHSLEKRLGLYLTSLATGLFLLIIASIYVTPAISTIAYGEWYQHISENPFDFANGEAVQLRILTPLLAFLLHLRGNLYIYFPLIVAVLFVSLVYLYFRRDRWQPSEAFGGAAVMALSAPVLFLLHYQGYTDITSYLLILLAVIYIKKPYLWTVFYALALLNHESNLFAAPWLIFMAASFRLDIKKLLIALGCVFVALIPFILFRYYASTIVDVEFGHKYYLNIERIIRQSLYGGKYFTLGVFMTFKLFWMFPFIGIRAAWARGARGEAAWYVLVLLCTFSQHLFGSDTTRLASIAFPAVLLGMKEARREMGSDKFTEWLWRLIGINIVMPQYNVINQWVVVYFPLPVSLIMWCIGIVPWTTDIWMT